MAISEFLTQIEVAPGIPAPPSSPAVASRGAGERTPAADYRNRLSRNLTDATPRAPAPSKPAAPAKQAAPPSKQSAAPQANPNSPAGAAKKPHHTAATNAPAKSSAATQGAPGQRGVSPSRVEESVDETVEFEFAFVPEFLDNAASASLALLTITTDATATTAVAPEIPDAPEGLHDLIQVLAAGPATELPPAIPPSDQAAPPLPPAGLLEAIDIAALQRAAPPESADREPEEAASEWTSEGVVLPPEFIENFAIIADQDPSDQPASPRGPRTSTASSAAPVLDSITRVPVAPTEVALPQSPASELDGQAPQNAPPDVPALQLANGIPGATDEDEAAVSSRREASDEHAPTRPPQLPPTEVVSPGTPGVHAGAAVTVALPESAAKVVAPARPSEQAQTERAVQFVAAANTPDDVPGDAFPAPPAPTGATVNLPDAAEPAGQVRLAAKSSPEADEPAAERAAPTVAQGPARSEGLGTPRPLHNAPPPPHDAAQVLVDRVAHALHAASHNGGQLRVRLHPPELGVLQIEITQRDGVLAARLETQSVSAQQAILDNISSLREALAHTGSNVERIEVHVAPHRGGENLPDHPGGRDEEPPQQRQQQEQGEQRRRDERQDQPADESRAPQRHAAGSMDELDIQI